MGILRIAVEDSVRVEAASARVHLSVKGGSTVFGNAATKQAAEVRELVRALAAAGIAEEAIEVTGVRLDSRGGFGKSKAEYLLVVAAELDQLPGVLGVLADQPVTLSELEWVFDSFEASIPATANALAQARRKAEAIAAAAGSQIAGIAMISDSWNLPTARVAFEATDSAAVFRSAKSAPIDLGVEISATQELYVHLTVDFELS
ncbi:MAG: SIMPL domain-containing protein [Propionicimonas sp.]